MSFSNQTCSICLGQRTIEIIRVEDEKVEKTVDCPFCNGKGFLHIDYHYFQSDYEKWWKRMLGDNYGQEQ